MPADWGEAPLLTAGCREAGRRCGGLEKHAVFPLCDRATVERVVPLQAYRERRSAPAGLAIRGFLRRHRFSSRLSEGAKGSPPAEECVDRPWRMRLEVQTGERCDQVELYPSMPAGDGLGPAANAMCRGDETVACCVTDLVERDAEVVVYWPDHYRIQICLPTDAPQRGIRTFLHRQDEQGEEPWSHP